MKKLIYILFIICLSINCNAQSFTKTGKVYSENSSTGRVKAQPVATGCTWIDSKGVSYPVYISESGSCYIIKTSKKTGKEYKQYLKPEVSKDICKSIGREYKAKKK